MRARQRTVVLGFVAILLASCGGGGTRSDGSIGRGGTDASIGATSKGGTLAAGGSAGSGGVVGAGGGLVAGGGASGLAGMVQTGSAGGRAATGGQSGSGGVGPGADASADAPPIATGGNGVDAGTDGSATGKDASTGGDLGEGTGSDGQIGRGGTGGSIGPADGGGTTGKGGTLATGGSAGTGGVIDTGGALVGGGGASGSGGTGQTSGTGGLGATGGQSGSGGVGPGSDASVDAPPIATGGNGVDAGADGTGIGKDTGIDSPGGDLGDASSAICYRMYGVNFSPYISADENPQVPGDQITNAELSARLSTVEPYVDWVRTFACNNDLSDAGRLIHLAGRQSAVGAWIGPTSTQAGIDANNAQIACLCGRVAAGDVDLAIVGSEVLLRGDVSEAQMLAYIAQVKACATTAGASVPVAYADVYSVLLNHPNILSAVDQVFANYYPYWEGRDISQAVAYVHRWHQQLKSAASGKEVIVSETGWPSCGSQLGDAIPSPTNAALYFLNFASWAQSNKVKYFYFEAFDEPWKAAPEGPQGACWGLWDSHQQMKTGMQPVFDCKTMPDNWTSPTTSSPVFRFASLPEVIDTNLSRFLVADTTAVGNTVTVNGVSLPASAFDPAGNFVTLVSLAPGSNTIQLTINDGTGVVLQVSKTVNFSPTYSTASRRLIYVDAVVGVAGSPSVGGTIVIDLDGNAPLGVIEGHHIVGISPDGREIYMTDRSVFGTSLHQQTRTLAFSQDIVSNGFLVSPDGTRLYSHNERLDVAANTPLANLPVDITTGSSWAAAPIPGGPVISPDGGRIFCNNSINVIDTVSNTVAATGLSGLYLSGLALSEDGTKLLVSEYSYGSGNVFVYDANTFAALGSASGFGDFVGEVKAVPGGQFAVVGSSGNPASPSGLISTFNVHTYAVASHASLPLGDNLAVSSGGEVVASSGESGLFQRAGIDVYLIDAAGGLQLEKTFFLGINSFQSVVGRPTNDQIRRITLKQ